MLVHKLVTGLKNCTTHCASYFTLKQLAGLRGFLVAGRGPIQCLPSETLVLCHAWERHTLTLRYVWLMKRDISIIFTASHTLHITFVMIKNKPVLDIHRHKKSHQCMTDDAYYSFSQFLSLQACIH